MNIGTRKLAGWLLPLALLSFAGCSSRYNTTLINDTTQNLVVEVVQKNEAVGPSYITWKKCWLAPKEECFLGLTTSYYVSAAPLNGDTIVVRLVNKQVKRITANSVSAFVTDTVDETPVEGQREITYIIRIKD